MRNFLLVIAFSLLTASPLLAQECPGGGHMHGLGTGKQMEECHAKHDMVRRALDESIRELQAVESSKDVNALQRAAAGAKNKLSEAKQQVEHCHQVMEQHRAMMKAHKGTKAAEGKNTK